MSSPSLTLADIAVGQRFRSASRTLSADEIVAYAREFDPQYFHTDPEAAKASFFGGLAASGWHTAGMTMRLLVEAMRIEGGIIGGGGEIAWPKPVRPGDTLEVEAEILEIALSRSRPGRAAVRVLVTTRNQHGETVQTFSPRIVVTTSERGTPG